jgi:uncharacterized membrane protein
MTVWVLAVGRMLGLGTSAGMRPSFTLVIIGVVSSLGWGPGLNATFDFLGSWLAIVIFAVLAIFESSFDKIPKLDRMQDRLIMPYRAIMGGVAGAATIPFGWQGILAGALVGGLAAWFTQYTKHLARPRTVPSDAVTNLMSLWEDLAVFAGALLTLLFSAVGYAVAAVSVVIYAQARSRRRAKYRRLRGQS